MLISVGTVCTARRWHQCCVFLFLSSTSYVYRYRMKTQYLSFFIKPNPQFPPTHNGDIVKNYKSYVFQRCLFLHWE